MPNTRTPFRPPFCPNPQCDSRTNPERWRFKKKGFFFRDRRPHRVQRYICHHCGRNFSSQTFATDYWLRRKDLLEPLFMRLVSCSGIRQIAREMQVAPSTIQRWTERLGRHCLLFHEQLRPRATPREALVLDGFRTFEHSQFWPMDLNLLIGESHFLYGFNDAELRRSGTMRPAQAVKRTILEKRYGRPDPRATQKQVEELLRRHVRPGDTVRLRTDEHMAYPRALRRLADRSFLHQTTSSKVARTTRTPLFPVNLADMLLRHCSANHKRETIAFSKRRQGALYRLAIWQVWRNYIKSASEQRRDPPPGQKLGLIDRALSVSEILSQRLFPDRFALSGWLSTCYRGAIKTRALAGCRVHAARYAQ